MRQGRRAATSPLQRRMRTEWRRARAHVLSPPFVADEYEDKGYATADKFQKNLSHIDNLNYF